MKNKSYPTTTAKIRAFAKEHTLWVISGNHHWEAYMTLEAEWVPDPKGHHQCTLTTVYWWPNYSAQTMQEVTLLAAQQNSDGSLHSAMKFRDKVLHCLSFTGDFHY
jgi:hypothetical protein